jgi:hypothetical protein
MGMLLDMNTVIREEYNSSSSSAEQAAAPGEMAFVPVLVASVLPDTAEQVEKFGEALCAQFPLPHCCNNPGCVELRGASELLLVGGKGCVCSRCRWVH